MKEIHKGRDDEEEYVNSYWMTLREREDAGLRKVKDYIRVPGELALEKATDLSQDGLRDGMKRLPHYMYDEQLNIPLQTLHTGVPT
jgi:hypothetical protein